MASNHLTPHKAKPNWKKLAIIALLVIILLLLAVLLGYRLPKKDTGRIFPLNNMEKMTSNEGQGTPEENAWKTYTNEYWEFQIDYPVEWFVSEGQIVKFSHIKNPAADNAAVVTVFRNSDVNPNSLAQMKGRYSQDREQFSILKDIDINGYPGFTFEYKTKNQRQAVVVDSPAPLSKIYNIFVTYPDAEEKNAIHIFNRMLSSFQIIESR